MVANVAKILIRHGLKPSVLTRGYGRKSRQKLIVIEPGTGKQLNPQEIGDEPDLLARLLPEIPIVLCADRYLGGKTAEEQFKVDAHILDDGFQHLGLARDLDIVLIDATQPLSNWQLLPAGRQREPLSALRRAQIAVITRTDSANPANLEKIVRKVSPATRIFRSQTVLREWTDVRTGGVIPQAKVREITVAAFCGIGNPTAFFGDLRRWGFNPVAEDTFPDHHVYTGGELQQFAAKARGRGAVALLTTQKDSVKFSPDWPLELPVLSCEIEFQVQDTDEFERSILTPMQASSR
jgi:tetraacyldisaccharide 4'-kinase